jgi:hypothetical protein
VAPGRFTEKYLLSVLHVTHIRRKLHDNFDGLIDMADYASRPETERENAFLSRALAAYVMQTLLEISAEEAVLALADGFDDNGIDGLYVDQAAKRVVIVQSKFDARGNGSPSVEAVQKLIQGFDDLINARFQRFNARLQARAAELQATLEDPQFVFELVFAHTGQEDIEEQPRRLFEDLLQRANDVSELVFYRVLKQSDVHRFVSDELEPGSINLDVVISDWGHKDGPVEAYYGLVPATDIADWYATYGTRLFSRNLRRFISDSEVNESITATLLQDPQNFWYYNNGITVLCGDISKKPLGGDDRRRGEFVCSGVTVVNGAQTVGCIGTVKASGQLPQESAWVLVRFISLSAAPGNFASEITRATNTQNRIERRDFVSLDPVQDRLRSELLLENGKVYAIKTGEPDPLPDTGCSVSEATIALACGHPDLALTVTAKREISRLWEDIHKPPYTLLFTDRLSVLKLWRSVEIARAVDATLKALQDEAEGRTRLILVHGNRFVLYRVFRRLSDHNLDDPDLNFLGVLETIPALTSEISGALVALVERQYSNNYPGSLFKNETLQRGLCSILDSGGPAATTAGEGIDLPTQGVLF